MTLPAGRGTPTLCELAGCVMGPFPDGQMKADGISFPKLILDGGGTLGRSAVLDQMIEVLGRDAPPPWYAVTTTSRSPLDRWHYVEYDSGEKELYDVSNGPCWAWKLGEPGDPCELDNVAGDPRFRQVQRALRERLAELKRERGG